MKGLETGKDKVKKICDMLRRETLEPAKLQAEEIVQQAQARAEQMIAEAEKKIQEMHRLAHLEREKEKSLCQSALQQACKQALAGLKQSIEEELFHKQLSKLVTKKAQEPAVLSQLINAVVKALEKEGTVADLSVYVPAVVPPRQVNELLVAEVLGRLREKSVLVGPLKGGIEVKLHKEMITIDLSDAALKELVATYARKDFKEMIFQSSLT